MSVCDYTGPKKQSQITSRLFLPHTLTHLLTDTLGQLCPIVTCLSFLNVCCECVVDLRFLLLRLHTQHFFSFFFFH